MKNIVCFIVFGFLFFACSDDSNDKHNKLVGNWNWIETSGGIIGTSITPESSGNTIKLNISDSEIKKYINSKLETVLTYTIKTGKSILGGTKEMIVYDNETIQSFTITDNVLVIHEESYDGYQYVYQKE